MIEKQFQRQDISTKMILIYNMLLFGKEVEQRGILLEVEMTQEYLKLMMEEKHGIYLQLKIQDFQLVKE